MQKLVEVKNLKKHFRVGRNKYLTAVDDVSFDIYKGETLGLVGESGCGKTTCGKTIMGLISPTGGEVLSKGSDIFKQSTRERFEHTRSAQIIFQDPYASLNPRMTVADIVGEGLQIHGLCEGERELEERVRYYLDLVGLNKEHASRFPHEFSGGQRQRIGIARALVLDPDFIVLDEPVSALDVSIQAQIVNLLIELQESRHLTYLFIAHDLSMVRHISDRVGVMYLGQLVELAGSEELYASPKHPYTQALLSAIPEADPEIERNKKYQILEGEVSSPINPSPGCRFAPRCKYVEDICRQKTPEFIEVTKDHYCACHLVPEA